MHISFLSDSLNSSFIIRSEIFIDMTHRVLSINDIPVHVEVSDTDELRHLGLMNRSYLPEGTGMLFIFPDERELSFWMKNTKVPLSIAFISKSGKILNIEQMQPFDLASSRSEGCSTICN